MPLMRVFVFLLVLANLLFFAWARGYLGGVEPDAMVMRAGSQLRPNQIRIVSNDQPPDEKNRASGVSGVSGETGTMVAAVATPSTPVEPPREEVCFMLSDLTQSVADSLERLFLFSTSRAIPSEQDCNASIRG